MSKKRLTPDQITGKLRQAEVGLSQGQTMAQANKKFGVAAQTFNKWRKLNGGLRPDQAKRLKELERENAQLKKLVANQSSPSLYERYESVRFRVRCTN